MASFNSSPSVLIRAARGSDGPALRRLAALDSRSLPAGELVVAEADGQMIAAIATGSGTLIADPFRRTSDVAALLKVSTGRRSAAERRGLAGRLGLRAAPRARMA
jgi:hypothetical protein